MKRYCYIWSSVEWGDEKKKTIDISYEKTYDEVNLPLCK